MANQETEEKELFDRLSKGGDDAHAVFLRGATRFFEAQGNAGVKQWVESTFFTLPKESQLAVLLTFLVPYLESKKETKH